MRFDTIPTKTVAGQAELESRELDLPWRARALLLAIRGERTVGQLRQQFGGRDMETLLEGLHELGLIDFTQDQLASLALQAVMPDGEAVRQAGRLRGFLFRRATPD